MRSFRPFLAGVFAAAMAYVLSPQVKKRVRPMVEKGMEKVSGMTEKGKEKVVEIKHMMTKKVMDEGEQVDQLGYYEELERLKEERNQYLEEIKELKELVNHLYDEIRELKNKS
ncbi:hypothetical protein [Thermosediminibacter oceani]|uniref:Uncharacterized protein n=1 Tax=Thermosediminibacter oceani (strain ATCC BAA-1034 / DSM 16646 / JW/IW-1228P) TaxID=555079 RepID=D9S1Y6_THEOJ|nr:hypothetical protein [Thermosediminibacter oceani]ADL07413.1 hypothetical protein Toce_0641 [Thermosediminibacter oceani DSM 16646]